MVYSFQSFPENVVDLPQLREKTYVFSDRFYAGDILSDMIQLESVRKIADYVDRVFCPNIRSGMSYAVADAYQHWSEVTEDELMGLLSSENRKI